MKKDTEQQEAGIGDEFSPEEKKGDQYIDIQVDQQDIGGQEA